MVKKKELDGEDLIRLIEKEVRWSEK